ncbi:MAG: hydrolase 1, exosortase A system-associated [Gammaproteobacteria bacterium]|nr:hydrolase 1, exosortase A system-associated [Gammaproteobacteria bacterium]
MSGLTEEALWLDHHGEQMLGILHRANGEPGRTGVVIVVGGPQYRVGSHRQFTLLARDLAAAGFPVLRFDYLGMGDSDGAWRDFEAIDADIGIAVDTLMQQEPTLTGVVLWGLCDAASANAFYAVHDSRVIGQVALNPWVRTSEGEAQAFIRHYYLQRLLDPALWRKIARLEFDLVGSLRDFIGKLRHSRPDEGGRVAGPAADSNRPLPERVRESQIGFGGRTLLILSGNDLTAREYEDRVGENPAWQAWTRASSVELHRLDEADHTFSRAVWRDQVAAWCRDWLREMPSR